MLVLGISAAILRAIRRNLLTFSLSFIVVHFRDFRLQTGQQRGQQSRTFDIVMLPPFITSQFYAFCANSARLFHIWAASSGVGEGDPIAPHRHSIT